MIKNSFAIYFVNLKMQINDQTNEFKFLYENRFHGRNISIKSPKYFEKISLVPYSFSKLNNFYSQIVFLIRINFSFQIIKGRFFH